MGGKLSKTKTFEKIEELTEIKKEYSVIGENLPRVDAWEKVTGEAKYTDDLQFGPKLLHAKLKRSTISHGLIKKIDISKALALPGVKTVITGSECPYMMGLYLRDRSIYAIDRVRYVGEPIAGVVAISEKIAEEALDLIQVEYEDLPSVFDPVYGSTPEAPILHPNLGNYLHADFIHPVPGTNISNHFKVRKGNVEEGFALSDFIIENTYEVPHIQHSTLETHVAVAEVDTRGNITLWSSSQSPYAQRNLLAQAFGLPQSKIRVITPYLGGGFGSKAGVTIEACLIPLAMKLPGYPIKLRMSREEEFIGTFVRQALKAFVKMGVNKKGEILALEVKYYWSAGAYSEYGVNITRASGYSSSGPYEIPNVKSDAYCVYTNHPVGGPYRGFGMSEIHFAIESHMDEAANRINMNPVEFRLKNALKNGSKTLTGNRMPPTGLSDCIRDVAKKLELDIKSISDDPVRVRGKGIAAMWKAPAMPPNAGSSVFLKFNEDGSLNILTSGMEIGQGFYTVLTQIASESLTIPPDKIKVMSPDTDRNPYEWQTVASRLTWSVGNALIDACEDIKKQVFSLVCKAWEVDYSSIYLSEGFVLTYQDLSKKAPLKDLVIYGVKMPDGKLEGGPIMGRGMFIPSDVSPVDPETGQGKKPVVHFTTGAQAVEVEVDRETGMVKVLRAASAFDVGKAINPLQVKRQMEGGFVQGLSSALFEDLKFDLQGNPINPSFTDYKVATSLDIPSTIYSNFIEVPEQDGPYGARGIGEHPMVPTAAAIANAVYDAIGIRVRKLPINPEEVLELIKEKGGEKK